MSARRLMGMVAGRVLSSAGPSGRNLLADTSRREATHITVSLCVGNVRMSGPGHRPIESRFTLLRAARRCVGNHPRPVMKHIRGGGPRPEPSCLERSHIQRETTASTPIASPRRCTDAGRLAHDTGRLVNSSRNLKRVAFRGRVRGVRAIVWGVDYQVNAQWQ